MKYTIEISEDTLCNLVQDSLLKEYDSLMQDARRLIKSNCPLDRQDADDYFHTAYSIKKVLRHYMTLSEWTNKFK